MVFRRREVVMAATVDYSDNARQQGLKLKERGKLEQYPVSELVSDLHTVISNRAPIDLANIFGVHAKIRVITTRYGSLTVFFGVILAGLNIITNYKDFFDGIQLIREHCALLIEGLLHDKYSYDDLEVNVSILHPRLDDPRELHLPRRLRRLLDFAGSSSDLIEGLPAMNYLYGTQGQRRDGLFWFLLVLCILLLGVVGVLIYGAVVKTYFP